MAKRARQRQPNGSKSSEQRRIIHNVAELIRTEFEAGRAASLFGAEGAVRHGLRSGFCLHGAKWSEADGIAGQIVLSALHRVGARRPTWLEAQTVHYQETAPSRELCLCCRKSLLNTDDAFCSRYCKGVWWRHERHTRWMSEMDTAATVARELAV